MIAARDSGVILSSSSSKITGLMAPARLNARMIIPGSASGEVFDWPRRSRAEDNPPNGIRINFRPNASATDLAKVVFQFRPIQQKRFGA